MNSKNLENHAKEVGQCSSRVTKEYKNHQEERTTRAVFVIHTVHTSLSRQRRPSFTHSLIHLFTSSDSNAVVLQGKVHQFNSNLLVSHEECIKQTEKQSPWKHIQHDIKEVNMYKSFNGKN